MGVKSKNAQLFNKIVRFVGRTSSKRMYKILRAAVPHSRPHWSMIHRMKMRKGDRT